MTKENTTNNIDYDPFCEQRIFLIRPPKVLIELGKQYPEIQAEIDKYFKKGLSSYGRSDTN